MISPSASAPSRILIKTDVQPFPSDLAARGTCGGSRSVLGFFRYFLKSVNLARMLQGWL